MKLCFITQITIFNVFRVLHLALYETTRKTKWPEIKKILPCLFPFCHWVKMWFDTFLIKFWLLLLLLLLLLIWEWWKEGRKANSSISTSRPVDEDGLKCIMEMWDMAQTKFRARNQNHFFPFPNVINCKRWFF